MLEYVIIGIIFIILLIIILEKDKALYFDVINVKIEEATKDITILLEKKLELLTKISKSLNDDSDEAKNVITNISKIKNKKLTIIELEKELYNTKLLLDKYIENNNIKIEEAETQNMINLLNNNEIEIKALKLFYNKEVETFNNDIKKFKNLFIKAIKKYTKLEVFSFQKEVEFEILKNNKK